MPLKISQAKKEKAKPVQKNVTTVFMAMSDKAVFADVLKAGTSAVAMAWRAQTRRRREAKSPDWRGL
jgi:hypothetical protein